MCTQCNDKIGDEVHCLLNCKSPTMRAITNDHLNEMYETCPQLRLLDDTNKLIYILKGHDISLLKLTCKWLKECNQVFSKY